MATVLKTKVLSEVPAYTPDWRVTAVVPNPKRPGCAAYDRFSKITVGLSVADLKVVLGKFCAAEIAWNFARGYVTIEPADSENAIAARELLAA
jgi:hypothetical protein